MHRDVPIDDDFDQRTGEFDVKRIGDGNGPLSIWRSVKPGSQSRGLGKVGHEIMAASEGERITVSQKPPKNEMDTC